MTTKDVAQLIAEATTDAEVCGDLVIVAAQLRDCVARLQAAHAARRALVELPPEQLRAALLARR